MKVIKKKKQRNIMKKSKIGWKKSIKNQYRESYGDEKWKRREYSNNRYRSMTFEEKPNLKVLW